MKITCGRCGSFLELNKIGTKRNYCNPCHSEYQRINRVKHSELSPEKKKKANARSYANTYERRGKLIPQPCEKCGSMKVEKHHEDYDKPLQVNWLCRPCHLELHAKDQSEVLETGTLK